MSIFKLSSSFSHPRYLTEYASQIQTGDFNADGNMDFVVSNIDAPSIGEVPAHLQLFLGDGRGGFNEAPTYFASTPWLNFVPRMLVEDFNNDGSPDVFGIDNGIDKEPFTGGQNKIFLSGAGQLVDGSYTHLPQGNINTHGASAGDIDNDGDVDLFINALMQDGNFLWLNDGSGHFTVANHLLPSLSMPNPWGGPPMRETHTTSALIDVNMDGWLDLIVGHWDAYNSTPFNELYLNDGRGSFASSPAINLPLSGLPGESVLSIKPINLNGDGMTDLAIAVTNGGSFTEFYKTAYVQLLVNQGDGIFVDETDVRLPQSRSPADAMTWFNTVEVVDLNRDGHDDMVLDNSNSGPRVFFNNGNGHFSETLHGVGTGLPDVPANQYSNLVGVADFDNDGMLDLIVSKQSNNVVTYSTFLNQLDGPQGLGRIPGGYDDTAIYRFYNTETSTHFYSGSKSEVENVLTQMPSFQFEGAAFSKVSANENTVDVFRFYNTETGTHFYTASAEEAEYVKATLPAFRAEGVAYKAYAEAVEATTALYRFYNHETGAHFYTASQAEMEHVRVELAGVMNYEGVGFYVGA